jgi:hypothetical protein
MEKITAYRFRGEIYDTKEKATNAIDDMIGKILTKHAHRLVHIDSYSAILDYLDSNLGEFHVAYLLYKDKNVCTTDDD